MPNVEDLLKRLTGSRAELAEKEQLIESLRAELSAMEEAAKIDHLTLFSSHASFETARHKLEQNSAHALILMDANGFKQINDQCSYDDGNLAIKHIAQIIRANIEWANFHFSDCMEPISIPRWVWRLGGDEFVIVCPKEVAPTLLRRICREHGVIDYDKKFKVGLSGGIGYDNGHKFEQAEAKMKRAKWGWHYRHERKFK